MLFGFPPFYVDRSGKSAYQEAQEIYKLIGKGFTPETKKGFGPWFPKFSKGKKKPFTVSDEAKDLIGKLLTKDVDKRLTATETLDHAWFKMASDKPLQHQVDGVDIPGLVIKSFKDFHQQNKFQVACTHVLSNVIKNMDQGQAKNLSAAFDAMDSDKDGSISLEEFLASMTNSDMSEKFDIKKATEMFESMDIDGSNSLNKDEMMVAVKHKMLTDRQDRLYNAFAELDQNGDGYIDREEMQSALKDSGALEEYKFLGDIDALMDAADTDNDGKISLAEFYESMDPPAHKDEYLLDGEIKAQTLVAAQEKRAKETATADGGGADDAKEEVKEDEGPGQL